MMCRCPIELSIELFEVQYEHYARYIYFGGCQLPFFYHSYSSSCPSSPSNCFELHVSSFYQLPSLPTKSSRHIGVSVSPLVLSLPSLSHPRCRRHLHHLPHQSIQPHY